MFLGSSINPPKFQCLLFLERTIKVLNKTIYLEVTVPQRAAFVIVINLSSELLLRDFRLVFSRCFLACFPPVPLLLLFYYSCFLLAGLSPLIYLLSCEKAIAQWRARSHPGSVNCFQSVISLKTRHMGTDWLQCLKQFLFHVIIFTAWKRAKKISKPKG